MELSIAVWKCIVGKWDLSVGIEYDFSLTNDLWTTQFTSHFPPCLLYKEDWVKNVCSSIRKRVDGIDVISVILH